jgi:hypothetical protein
MQNKVIVCELDPKRFERVFKFLVGRDKRKNELETVFLACVLYEVCWRLFREHGGAHIDNADEFRSEMIVGAKRLATEGGFK